MTALAITVLTLVFWIGVIALLYWVVVWALGKFGIPIPAMVVQILFALFVLALIIYALRAGLLPALP